MEIYSPAAAHDWWPDLDLLFPFQVRDKCEKKGIKGQEREKESDAWMNTRFVHLSHVDRR